MENSPNEREKHLVDSIRSAAKRSDRALQGSVFVGACHAALGLTIEPEEKEEKMVDTLLCMTKNAVAGHRKCRKPEWRTINENKD